MGEGISEYLINSPEIFVLRGTKDTILLDVEKSKVHKKPTYFFDALADFKNQKLTREKLMEKMLFDGWCTKENIQNIVDFLTEVGKEDRARKENTTGMRAQLVVSEACNLGCTYCKLSDENLKDAPLDDKGKLMSIAQARKSLDYILSRKPKAVTKVRISLTPGVGEPICNLDTIERLMDYSDGRKENDVDVTFYFATNATLLDDDIIRRITQRENLNVYISIDGNEKVHDTLRRTRGGKPTYQIVAENARKLISRKNRKQSIGASTVLTAIDTNFDQLYQNLLDIGFDYIVMRPIRACPTYNFGLNEKTMESFKSGYDKLCKLFKETSERRDYRYLLSLAPDYDFFARPFFTLLMGEKRYHRCPDVPPETKDISNFNMVFDPSGDIAFPCRELAKIPEFKVGNINSGALDEQKIRRLSVPDNESIGVCSDSWERYVCGGGGGCYSAQYFVTGSIYQPDKYQCELIRHVTKLSMRLLAEVQENGRLVSLLKERVANVR
jgi:uncharacterized protein